MAKIKFCFLYLVEKKAAVYDLFNISNSTSLPLKRNVSYEIWCNGTGEEFFIFGGDKIYVYLHKPMFKSLTLLSASVVAKTYTKSDLTKMSLPRQLCNYF